MKDHNLSKPEATHGQLPKGPTRLHYQRAVKGNGVSGEVDPYRNPPTENKINQKKTY